MGKIIIAGACSVFGLSDIKIAFEKLGFEVEFVDAPFMAGIKLHDFPETSNIVYTAVLPEDSLVLPLSEYWISYCTKHKGCRISEKAISFSRSKKFFYEYLNEKGFDSPEIYKNIESAEAALMSGKRVVVKPLGLHSGYGIEVLGKEKAGLLEEYFSQAQKIKNRTLRIMEIENNGAMITEAISGTEYSADGFWFEGRFTVVRICRKVILEINDKPCSAVYALISPDSLEFSEYSEKLKKWTESIMGEKDISFVQYDFISEEKNSLKTGRVVPIDFACRVGGGITNLMIESGVNSYAEAVLGVNGKVKKNLYQLNYLPVVSGYVQNDSYNLLPGKTWIYKKKGDYVISNPSSVGSRIGVTVSQMEDFSDKIIPNLLIGEKYITRSYNK